MKAIFSAFGGKLESDIVDLPEETPYIFTMLLDMSYVPREVFYDNPSPVGPRIKRGTFEFRGDYAMTPNNQGMAKVYVLVDVS